MAARLPLSALLSMAIAELNKRCEEQGAGVPPMPSLAVWSNVLQHVPDEGIDQGELITRSRLSSRILKFAVGRQTKRGVLVVEGKTVSLTPAGRDARDAFADLLASVEQRWRVPKKLRSSLEKLVGQLELEHPHYPSQYAGADPRVTGGPGRDWKPVERAGGNVSELPLSALLSQALTAFSIEYEMSGNGPLGWTASVLRFIEKPRVPIEKIPPTSVPISGMERHGALRFTVDARKRKLLTMTALGRRVKERYGPATKEIEQDWRARYGAKVIDDLRASLESLKLDEDLPHYPRADLIWT